MSILVEFFSGDMYKPLKIHLFSSILGSAISFFYFALNDQSLLNIRRTYIFLFFVYLTVIVLIFLIGIAFSLNDNLTGLLLIFSYVLSIFVFLLIEGYLNQKRIKTQINETKILEEVEIMAIIDYYDNFVDIVENQLAPLSVELHDISEVVSSKKSISDLNKVNRINKRFIKIRKNLERDKNELKDNIKTKRGELELNSKNDKITNLQITTLDAKRIGEVFVNLLEVLIDQLKKSLFEMNEKIGNTRLIMTIELLNEETVKLSKLYEEINIITDILNQDLQNFEIRQTKVIEIIQEDISKMQDEIDNIISKYTERRNTILKTDD